MRFNKNLVSIFIFIILLSLSAIAVYVVLDEFDVITHEIKNEPFEYPKQE
ncbi:hypothetical protein [Flavobacterium sp. TSSA_36]